VWLISLV